MHFLHLPANKFLFNPIEKQGQGVWIEGLWNEWLNVNNIVTFGVAPNGTQTYIGMANGVAYKLQYDASHDIVALSDGITNLQRLNDERKA